MATNGDAPAVAIDEAELRKRLTPEQYHVTREKGTERAFTGKYYQNKEAGTYHCVVCNQALFASDTKFDSGTGTPATRRAPLPSTAVRRFAECAPVRRAGLGSPP